MTQAATGVDPSQPGTPNWHIRPARAEDEAGVLALYRASFGRERSGADWRWKLLARPGLAPLVWVAESGAGDIVGHHAGIPLRFSMAGQELDAVLAVESMTAPTQRGKGLLLALGKGLYDSWADAGVAFVLGMPNEQWGSKARAIGFVPFARLRWLKLMLRPSRALAGKVPAAGMLRPLDPLAAGLGALLLRAPSGIKVREVGAAGDDFARLWARAAPSYRQDYLLVRGPAYVQWRFLDCPAPYRLLLATDEHGPAGYAAFRVTADGQRIGWLADLFAPRDAPGAWRALLGAAVKVMRDDGAVSIAALAGHDSVFYRVLRRGGFLPARHEFTVSMVPGAWPGCATAMSEAGRWQLAGGNFDVI